MILSTSEVAEWFNKNRATMIPGLDETFTSEISFWNCNYTEKLTCDITYTEGCPTCGGAYVKKWTLAKYR